MIRHVVMWRWNEGAEEAHIASVTAAFAQLPAKIPEIGSYAFGPDLGVAETNLDYAVTGEFDSIEAFVTYRDHPAHQALVQTYLLPHIHDRSAVQFTIA